MTLNEVALGALAVALLLLVVGWIRRVRLHAGDRAWRPLELQDAELVYVERMFRARWPIRLVGRVDRGYRQPDGSIVLVELKTRGAKRAYFSDIIELSAQRLAVESQTGKHVDDYGYVLVQAQKRSAKIPHRVRLLPAKDVIALARRREVILSGNAVPQWTRFEGLCRQCAFEQKCRAKARLRRLPHAEDPAGR